MSFPYPCVWSGSAFHAFPTLPGAIELTFPPFTLVNDFVIVVAQTLSVPNINTTTVATILHVGATPITTILAGGVGDASRSAAARAGYSTGNPLAKVLLVTGGGLTFNYGGGGVTSLSAMVGAAIFDVNLTNKTAAGINGLFSVSTGSLPTNPYPVQLPPGQDPITGFPLITAALVGDSSTPLISVAAANNPPSQWTDVLNASNGNHQICISMYQPINGGQGYIFNLGGVPLTNGGEATGWLIDATTTPGISRGRSFAQLIG